MKLTTSRKAELLSGLGAIVLGAGLALVAPLSLKDHAWWLLGIGVIVHGAGMTLKYRLESSSALIGNWDRFLFWLCWAGLGVISIGVVAVIWRG